MLGYDISWAAFNVIEVMSSTKFTYKVIIFKLVNILIKF
jgi:AP-3 complex subunit delta-1